MFLFVPSDSHRDGFRLLCTDGTQAPLSHYRNCNLGRGPGGGMVTRFNFRKVARKFLVTVQVKSLFSRFLFPLSPPNIKHFVSTVNIRKCPFTPIKRLKDSLLLFRCCLANEDERGSASNSSTRLLLERTTFSSKM